jgi:4'-phosphopantetheinyl transferase
MFERDCHGKPALKDDFPRLYFSCSHTPWVSAVAVSSHHPIGIDIESTLLTFDDPSLVEEFFTVGERRALQSLPEGRRGEARVRLWTLKEAVVKMLGTGLAHDISKLEFDIVEDHLKPARSPELELSGMRLATWSIPNQAQPLSVALAVKY